MESILLCLLFLCMNEGQCLSLCVFGHGFNMLSLCVFSFSGCFIFSLLSLFIV